MAMMYSPHPSGAACWWHRRGANHGARPNGLDCDCVLPESGGGGLAKEEGGGEGHWPVQRPAVPQIRTGRNFFEKICPPPPPHDTDLMTHIRWGTPPEPPVVAGQGSRHGCQEVGGDGASNGQVALSALGSGRACPTAVIAFCPSAGGMGGRYGLRDPLPQPVREQFSCRPGEGVWGPQNVRLKVIPMMH